MKMESAVQILESVLIILALVMLDIMAKAANSLSALKTVVGMVCVTWNLTAAFVMMDGQVINSCRLHNPSLWFFFFVTAEYE